MNEQIEIPNRIANQLLQQHGIVTGTSEPNFMKNSLRRIVQTPNHPLQKILVTRNSATNTSVKVGNTIWDWEKVLKVTKNGKTILTRISGPQGRFIMDAGDMSSKWLVQKLGLNQIFALELADFNRPLSGSLIETKGAAASKGFIVIEGVAIEAKTAKDLVSQGILTQQDIEKAVRIIPGNQFGNFRLISPSSRGTPNQSTGQPGSSRLTGNKLGTPANTNVPVPSQPPQPSNQNVAKISPAPKPSPNTLKRLTLRGVVTTATLALVRIASGLIISTLIGLAISALFTDNKDYVRLRIIKRGFETKPYQQIADQKTKKMLESNHTKKRIRKENSGNIRWYVEMFFPITDFALEGTWTKKYARKGGVDIDMKNFIPDLKNIKITENLDTKPVLYPPKGKPRHLTIKRPIIVFDDFQFLNNIDEGVWVSKPNNFLSLTKIKIREIKRGKIYEINNIKFGKQSNFAPSAKWNDGMLQFDSPKFQNQKYRYYFYPTNTKTMMGFFTKQIDSVWTDIKQDSEWKLEPKI